jgi:hypothetical protein
MASFRGRLRYATAFGVLMLSLLASEARAGNVTIVITIDAIVTITIQAGSSLAQPGSTADNLTVNTTSLNNQLALDGSTLQFSALGATSNNTGGASSFITQTGTAFNTSATAASLNLLTFQTGFISPIGTSGTMQSSASNTYTSTTAGDSQTFQSWFDQSNSTPPVKSPPASSVLTFTSTGPAIQSYSGTSPVVGLANVVAPYGILNQTSLTLTGVNATDQFTGSTLINASSVPEPTSLALLGVGMAGFFALRRLFKRTAAA